MSIEKANEIIKGIQTGEIGCTIEEFKSAIKDNKEVNEKELSTVVGGRAPGPGGCKPSGSMFYEGPCAATVELNSWCKSNDWCNFWDCTYHIVGK